MTKEIRDWTKYNCKNCAFRMPQYKCGRTGISCNDMAKQYLKEERKDCIMAEYEEV